MIRQLERRGEAPLYVQAHQALRQAIEAGDFAPGAALPPERDLAVQFGVSRITIRKALGELVGEGMLARRQGAGTFVSQQRDRIEKSLTRITSFSEDMRARGFEPNSEWISRTSGPVKAEEALALGLSPGSLVFRLVRVRYADNLPLAVETAIVPARCLNSVDDVTTSLYEAMAAHGCQPTRALQRLRAVGLEPEQAGLLGLETGTPALLIERRGFDQSGQVIEFTTSYYRGDAYDFLAELNG